TGDSGSPAEAGAGPGQRRGQPRGHRPPCHHRALVSSRGAGGGVSAALRGAMAHLPVDINPRPPRRNSFEVSLVKEDGSTMELWSGIGKGPPRKLKFPQPETVVEALKSSLA
uniref:Selenoprotein H n=1 Tax=Cyanistes caeruleus TaxID=156563 RepID=A0A8C0VGK0_CYACU